MLQPHFSYEKIAILYKNEAEMMHSKVKCNLLTKTLDYCSLLFSWSIIVIKFTIMKYLKSETALVKTRIIQSLMISDSPR